MFDLSAYYTKAKRPRLSRKLFFNHYNRLPKSQASALRDRVALAVLIKKLTTHDKDFLTVIGFDVLDEKRDGMAPEKLDQLFREGFDFLGNNVYKKNILFFPRSYLKFYNGWSHKRLFYECRNIEKTCFKDFQKRLYQGLIYTIPNSIEFESRKQENKVLVAMKYLIQESKVMSMDKLAKKFVSSTNTTRKTSIVHDFLRKA